MKEIRWTIAGRSGQASPTIAIVRIELGQPRVGAEVTCVETGRRYRVVS